MRFSPRPPVPDRDVYRYFADRHVSYFVMFLGTLDFDAAEPEEVELFRQFRRELDAIFAFDGTPSWKDLQARCLEATRLLLQFQENAAP